MGLIALDTCACRTRLTNEPWSPSRVNLPKFLTNAFKKKAEVEPLEIVKTEEDEALQEILDKPTSHMKSGPPAKVRLLEDEHQLELIKLIAQGLTSSQIIIKFKEELDITLNYRHIYNYRHAKKWQEKIRELKTYYRSNVDSIPGSHKSVRIRRMEFVMDKASKKGDLRAAISANEQIRKEFEKEGGEINIFHNNPVYQQFNNLSNEELIRRHKEATLKIKGASNGPSRPAEENKE